MRRAFDSRAFRRAAGRGQRPRRAFTLLELLIVLAILSLLVSVLIPSLQKAKELAREVICVDRERTPVRRGL